MAGEQKLQGIGLDVVADAAQIKKTFNEAIGSLQGKKIEMILTADWDKTTQSRIASLRKTKVPIDVVLSPTRQSIRDLRSTIRQETDKAPVQIGLKVKPITKSQGNEIRQAIQRAVGTPTIDVILNPRYGEGGPIVGGRPGGPVAPGGGQRGAAPGTQARSPVSEAQAPRGGAGGGSAAGAVTAQAFSARLRTLRQQEGETDTAWQERMIASRMHFLDVLEKTDSENARRRANNALVNISELTGEETQRARIAASPRQPKAKAEKGVERPATDTSAYPERVTRTGEKVRGGPDVGLLASDVFARPQSDAEFLAKKAREEGRQVNAARRPREELALVDQNQQTLQTLRQQRAELEGRLKSPQRSSRFRGIQAEIAELEGQTAGLQERFGGAGFHAQRTQRSFFGPGVFPSRTLSQRQEEVARTADTTLRDAFANLDRLRGGQSAKALGLEGPAATARDKRRMRELLGSEVSEALEKVSRGDFEGALGLAPKQAGTKEGTGLRGAMETLLTRGRQAPDKGGVGRGVVGRLLKGKDLATPLTAEGEIDQERLDQQAAFAFELQTLQDLIGSITTAQRDITKTARPKRRRRRKDAGPLEPSPLEPEEILSRADERFRGAQGPVKVEVEDVEPEATRKSTRAAQNVSAFEGIGPIPGLGGGSVGGGGGEGEGGFIFGGGGGVVPVEVTNWPGALLEEGGVIAAQGASPAGLSPSDFERLAQPFLEGIGGLAEKLGQPGQVGKKGGTRRGPGGKPTFRRTTPLSMAQGLVNRKLISPEEAEEIVNPPVSGQPSDLDIARQGIEEQLAQARQGLPIRGFAVSVAQQLAGGARGKTFARFQQAGERLREAGEVSRAAKPIEQEVALAQRALDNLNKKQAETGKLTRGELKDRESLTKQIEEGSSQLAEYATIQKGLTDEASKLAQLTGGEKIANLGKSLVGSIGGTVAFGTALGAVGAAAAGIGVALGMTTERLGGYKQATVEITNTLSDQVRAQQGAVKQSIAQASAQANLSKSTYETIAPMLEQRAAVEAGNKAFQEQLKLAAASRNVGAEQRTVGGQRFDKGLFETTGGFVVPGFNIQTNIGGTPSTQELIGQQIDAAIREQFSRGGFEGGFSRKGEGGLAGLLRPGGGGSSTIGDPLSGLLEDLQGRFEGTAIEFVSGTDAMAASAAAAAKAFEEAGFDDIADQLSKVDTEGRPLVGVSQATTALAPEQIATAVAQAVERMVRPDPQVLLQALNERIIPATIIGIRENLRNTLDVFLPAQRGIQLSAQPVAPFGRGLVPLGEDRQLDTAGVTGLNIGGRRQFAGVPQEAVQSFTRYRDEAQAAIDAVSAAAERGRQVLAERLGVPESTIAELQAFGTRIGEINQEQADLRLDLQYSQYNRQLFIARRTLGDIAGLLGRAGGTQIGQLQREQLLLSRRSQALGLQSQQLGLQTGELQQQSAEIGQQSNLLQLQQSQRQINFQRSLAGFVTPGQTPEEIAARMAEAEIEADFAQKQLDFQKEQFQLQRSQLAINREQLEIQKESFGIAQSQVANQIALQDATNERAYEDQLAAIAELQKAFATGIEIQALEDLKNAITQQRDIFVEELRAQVDAEQEFIKAQTQFAVDVMAQSGDFVTNLVSTVTGMFTKIRAENAWFFGNMPSPGGGAGGTPGFNAGEGTGGSPRFNAPGFLGTVSHPTQMVMGDAGSELVAILRNPRPVLAGASMGGSSGGLTINVSVTGNTIGGDRESADELANRIASRVEQVMSRRSSLLGLRQI